MFHPFDNVLLFVDGVFVVVISIVNVCYIKVVAIVNGGFVDVVSIVNVCCIKVILCAVDDFEHQQKTCPR